MAKKIKDYSELIRICESAGLWFVGSFLLEIIKCYDEFLEPESKANFINRFFKDYSSASENGDIMQVRNKINCCIRIINSGEKYIIKALEAVIETNPKKLGCPESKENAQYLLNLIKNKEIELPKPIEEDDE